MFTFAYPAVFDHDEDGRWLVSFGDFPTAHTDGANAHEAMEEAIDCLGSNIAFAMADKTDIPKPSPTKRGQKLVPVQLWIVAKLALYWAIRELGVSQSELARRLGVWCGACSTPTTIRNRKRFKRRSRRWANESSWHTVTPRNT
jgi:antitoxin HicB